ncbi:hypothetical protein KQX54_011959 [Cotesia glomerata]|uniref:Uncharacterized protein n=1 Tax=Cotesia glomerata TaxID=32391 RepID=A0AAV7J4Z4_COTGL|nr:hypothetical protein KQX54_011959 [Cotesia glomerata]
MYFPSVKARNGYEWSDQTCDRFGDLSWVAQWKVLIAKVRGFKERVISQGTSRREGSPIPCVDLYDKNDKKDIDIGKQLVIENLAVLDDGSWSTASSTASLLKHQDVSSPSLDSTLPVTTKSSSPQRKITPEVIDLTTPRKRVVEEVDLVTPQTDRKKKSTFDKKKQGKSTNGTKQENKKLPVDTQPRHLPGGEESYDEYSDELEMF